MEKGAVKLVVFNGDDFGYWKKSNLEPSSKSGTCYLGDRAGGVCDPSDARQRYTM
jgi:hypothetical protein